MSGPYLFTVTASGHEFEWHLYNTRTTPPRLIERGTKPSRLGAVNEGSMRARRANEKWAKAVNGSR